MPRRLLLVIISACLSVAIFASLAWAQDGSNFANTCNLAWEGPQDPIYEPSPEDAHAHIGYGALSVSNDSTGESLVGTPTSCSRADNSSAYWHPVVYRNGAALEVDTSKGLGDNTIYYRSGGLEPSKIRAFPRGFELVARDKNGPGEVEWACDGKTPQDTPPERCANQNLVMRITFPNCWDGRDNKPADVVDDERGKCPSTHPKELATISMSVNFVLPQENVGRITVAGSDHEDGQMGFRHAHADFVNGWDQETLRDLTENCITGVAEDTLEERKPLQCKDPGNRD